MNMRIMQRRGMGAALAALALAVGACGSGDDGASGSGGGSSDAKADIAGAKAAVAEFSKQPPFPVDEPLSKPVPKGSEFAFLQCSAPICALFSQILKPGVEAVGGTFSATKADASATGLQQAAASIRGRKPAAMMIPASDAAQYGSELKTFKTDKIPVVSVGVMDAEKYGITADYYDSAAAKKIGALLADWSIARKGTKADVVFYVTPELSFAPRSGEGFKAEMDAKCPACKYRLEKLPVATINSTAPNLVVSDLQRHPDTNIAVFSTNEASTGVPAALKTAGITIDTLGSTPTPANLQDVKDGKQTATLALDLPVYAWTWIDITAREITGKPLTKNEQAAFPPVQFLEQKDITFDASKGYTAYPDFAKRFIGFWKGAGQ